jgi:hypothetical protein
MTKTDFLVGYDYGTGGVWAYLLADSPDEIAQRYPELQVISERPSWMSDDEERGIRERMTIDIDDEANEFLAALRSSRG